MMARPIVVCLLASLSACGAHAAVTRGGKRAFLTADDGDRMRPDLVAKTLSSVQDEWRNQAAAFTEGDGAAAKSAPRAFAASCATVVGAVVQGSGGDRDVAQEYMERVCGEKQLVGWHKLRCHDLATAITGHAMLADNYANRQRLSATKVCDAFWKKVVDAERNREAEEAKERAVQEKARAEEEQKKALAAAEAKKKADAEAAAAAKKKAELEARRVKQEKEKKAEKEAAAAKSRAVAAAARLALKKAEAQQVQYAAQQKLEEAKKAEQEHQARLKEHKKAEEQLKHVTAPTKSITSAKTTPTNSITSAKSTVVAKAADGKTVNGTKGEVAPVHKQANATSLKAKASSKF